MHHGTLIMTGPCLFFNDFQALFLTTSEEYKHGSHALLVKKRIEEKKGKHPHLSSREAHTQEDSNS